MAYSGYILLNDDTYTQVENIESITYVDVETKHIGRTYRDTGWLLPSTIASSLIQDDGDAAVSGAIYRVPDEMMHVAPRSEKVSITFVNITCTGSKVYMVPFADFKGIVENLPVRY